MQSNLTPIEDNMQRITIRDLECETENLNQIKQKKKENKDQSTNINPEVSQYAKKYDTLNSHYLVKQLYRQVFTKTSSI